MRLDDGKGGFPGVREVELDDRPFSVAAGDLDGDGDPDIVAVGGLRWLWVIRNEGRVQLAKPLRHEAVSFPSAVALGDIDGDGDLDLVCTALGEQGAVLDQVWLLRNEGNGSFAPAQSIPAGCEAETIAAGDFDGDGNLDLAVAGGLSDVVILHNGGGGAFTPAGRIEAGSGPTSLCAVDLDGDGRADLAVACSKSNRIKLLWGGKLLRP